MKQKQSGFTLVELVTTVTIVGVLAAVALPRFANVSSDARAGVIKNLAGAMKQTNDTIYSKASTANISSLSSGSISFPDGKGTFRSIATAFGYAASATALYDAMVQNPDLAAGTDGSLATTARLSALQTVNGDLVQDQAIAPQGAIQHQKVQDRTLCEVGYTAAANSNTAPVYITVITNCS